MCSFEMSIKKVFITTAITTIVIAIATATTTFPNVAVLATPFLEQGGMTPLPQLKQQRTQESNNLLFT
jgi:hypothetical protein